MNDQVELLKVVVNDVQELPIYISVSEHDILCMTHLFKKQEVKPDMLAELNQEMLSANISLPLSSFAMIGDQYVVYGALSLNAQIDEIIEEIQAVSMNSMASLEAMSIYLCE